MDLQAAGEPQPDSSSLQQLAAQTDEQLAGLGLTLGECAMPAQSGGSFKAEPMQPTTAGPIRKLRTYAALVKQEPRPPPQYEPLIPHG